LCEFCASSPKNAWAPKFLKIQNFAKIFAECTLNLENH
jgi:hypothetical protein